MLRKLVEKEKPHYLGIVFDVKGPTVRHSAFKDYKAHRKPMPEDLEILPTVARLELELVHDGQTNAQGHAQANLGKTE